MAWPLPVTLSRSLLWRANCSWQGGGILHTDQWFHEEKGKSGGGRCPCQFLIIFYGSF